MCGNARNHRFYRTKAIKRKLDEESMLQTATKRIALLGLFGVGNLGNEASLAAALFHVRASRPDAPLVCICAEPADVAVRHGIEAVSLTMTTYHPWQQSTRRLWRLLLRVPVEVQRWVKTYRFLQGVDLIIVPGTGILDDFGVGPMQMPYDLFVWSLLAKLCGTKLRFVSIGAGPIHHPFSRWLMKTAAQAADYRSYRDQISKTFMHEIGLDTSHDSVYPDLVFSLPKPAAATQQPDQATRTVGLGMMAYYGWRNDAETGEQLYQTYIAKLARFTLWLIEKGYNIRILIGESTDQRAVDDLMAALGGVSPQTIAERIVAEPITSLAGLLQQIAATDLVVATRFHNVLCGFMMNKPVVSLGYAQKNDVLMTEMGLGGYCQHIESFDVDQIICHFVELEQNKHQLHAHIQAKNQQYQQALMEQYAHIFTIG